jgi:hypothetical protein
MRVWRNKKIQAKSIDEKTRVIWDLDLPRAFNPREMCIGIEKNKFIDCIRSSDK